MDIYGDGRRRWYRLFHTLLIRVYQFLFQRDNFAKGKATIFSAGIETHGVNPKAIQVMAEDKIDISHHTSNNIDEYEGIAFDYILTVCDNAKENCPWFPSNAMRFHQNFPDPAKATGDTEEILQQFRKVRDLIKAYAEDFAAQI